MRYGHLIIIVLVVFLIGYGLGSAMTPEAPPEPTVIEVEYRIIIETPEEPPSPKETNLNPIDDEELDLLARLVSAEAKGEPFEGQVAVANVVLNRVNSDKWPDTITEVIFEPKQFSPVDNGAIYDEPTKQSLNAVLVALEGEQVVPKEVDCFANYKIDFSSWAYYYNQIGNHIFWVSK